MAYNYYPNYYNNMSYQPQMNTGMMWVNGETEAPNEQIKREIRKLVEKMENM